jgi:hypothetical protein
MAETEDNVVLRLLREIRADTQDTRHRLTKVERKLEELHEGMVQAMGVAALASVRLNSTAKAWTKSATRLRP